MTRRKYTERLRFQVFSGHLQGLSGLFPFTLEDVKGSRKLQESLDVPENPFSQERLKALPGGMTRIGGEIIDGKLQGHARSSELLFQACS